MRRTNPADGAVADGLHEVGLHDAQLSHARVELRRTTAYLLEGSARARALEDVDDGRPWPGRGGGARHPPCP